MKRIWQIEEQVVEDPSTKLRFEFSSIHTDELAAGNEAPSHDGLVYIRMWTTDRARVATLFFERNGKFIRAEIEPVEQAATAQGRPTPIDRDMQLRDRDPADVGPETLGLVGPATFA